MSCKQISHTYSKLYTLMFICSYVHTIKGDTVNFNNEYVHFYLQISISFRSESPLLCVWFYFFFLAVLFCNVSVCRVARCFSSSCQRSPHPSVSIVSTFTICTGYDNGSGIIHHSIAFGRKVSENYLN